MQRLGSLLGSQVLVLLFVGSWAWTHQATPGGDDYDSMKRLMYSYGVSPYKRLPSYEFGLGKRSYEDPSSYEDASAPSSLSPGPDYYSIMDKRAPGGKYSFGLGKRNRAYTFGLGKRLEQAWKASAASANPTYRQERRSKYSFGLGKRGFSSDLAQDDSQEDPAGGAAGAEDKRSRQFSFGLGKREVDSSSHTNNTS